jgi:hypothetical protein
MEDIGDGYQLHESRPVRWQEVIGWTESSTRYPAFAASLQESRRKILIAVYAIEDRRDILRDASSAASKHRWQTRDAYDASARNLSISDEEVAVLSNAAWWAEQDYARADRAHNALFAAGWRMRDKLAVVDRDLQKVAVTTNAHWHAARCQICKDAELALAALEARGPR